MVNLIILIGAVSGTFIIAFTIGWKEGKAQAYREMNRTFIG